MSSPHLDSFHMPETAEKNDGAMSRLAPAPLRERLLPLLNLLPVSATAAIIFAVWLLDTTFDANTYVFHQVNNHRNAVQVIVTIISSTLAASMTSCVTSSINLLRRPRLARKPQTVDSIRLYTALSHNYLDFTLPTSRLIVLLLFWGSTLVPTWLWTGSLTPRVTLAPGNGSLAVVMSGPGSYSFLQHREVDPIDNGCWSSVQVNGTFSNCPGLFLSPKLLEAATTSSNASNATLHVHLKPDNSEYRYVGRSFGVGSAVGLSHISSPRQTVSYHWKELGFMTSFSCAYNQTSAWRLTHNVTNADASAGIPYIYYALGRLPNANYSEMRDFYAQTSLSSDPDSIVALATRMNPRSPVDESVSSSAIVAIAAGAMYSRLNNIQCTISFKPQRFNIEVSTIDRVIKVTSDPSSDQMSLAKLNPEPRGQLEKEAITSLRSISLVQTTLYVSTLGDAFQRSITALANRTTPLSQNDSEVPDALVLRAVQDSFEAVMDDILGLLQATALTQSGSWEVKSIGVKHGVVKIGTKGFVLATATVHFVMFPIMTVIILTTKLFKSSIKFDFADIGSLAVAVHNSGLQDDETAISCRNAGRANAVLQSTGIVAKEVAANIVRIHQESGRASAMRTDNVPLMQ